MITEQKTDIEQNPSKKNSEIAEILLFSLIACGIIGYFDGFAPIPYLYKALGKTCMFFGFPFLFAKRHPTTPIKDFFAKEKKPLQIAAILGITVFTVIFGSYLITKSIVDLSSITGELDSRMSINAKNFIAVAFYIAICNSFMEEFFFRGFLFFRLKERTNSKVAHLLSSVIFALYHVAIMVTWFQWWVFALCMLALVIGGVIFNLMIEKTGSLYPSWLTHGCANLAINSIGMILFYGG